MPNLDSQEQKLAFELMEALTSSLDLSKVLARAYELLSQLLGADYAAICISKPGRLPGYDRMVAAMPAEYFSHYHEMAPEDFIREAGLNHAPLELRELDPGPREAPEQLPAYRRYRELGTPLEHVMAVLLDVGRDWHGGFMLYRDRHQPFSERERALMQRITPLLKSVVRNCREMGEAQVQSSAMEQLFRLQGVESIVMASPTSERLRTPGATALLESWFLPQERGPNGLPHEVLERLRVLTSGRRMNEGPEQQSMTFEKERKVLRVNFVPLPERGSGRLWGLLFQEVVNGVVPPAWRDMLTPREVQVVECVLRGWDNKLIAEHLECAKGTVKKHLQRVFDKMGVDSRSALMNRAARQ
jgi:DNA-binding CsgD family transcriptional regulator